jgi:hypothetical protein
MRTTPCGPDERFCSLVSRAVGEEPIGSAEPFDAYLLFEMAPPWRGLWYEAKSAGQELLDTMDRARARGGRFRPLAIAPDDDGSGGDERLVVVATRPRGLAKAYVKRDYRLPAEAVVPLVEAVLLDPERLTRFAPFATDSGLVRDLLVCTHGSVDVCCGTFGFPAYRALRERAAGAGTRVWRASHFGGHNFAPTIVDLPDGRWWGHVGPEHHEPLLARRGHFGPLTDAYRGSGLLAPLIQFAERAILEREGWSWAEVRMAGRVLRAEGHGDDDDLQEPTFAETPPARALVRVDFERPCGRTGAYLAEVVRRDSVMTLRHSRDGARTPAHRFDVSDLRLV